MSAIVGGLAARAQERPETGGDVLLTFDTEFEDDAAALESLDLDVPATYFWTGSYAQKHPELLRRLAEQGNTIGSHSFHHDDLTTISARQVQLDLELARLVIGQIAGVPVTAFRAPYLQYDDEVMAEVAQLGHVVDSSDKSPWPRNRRLLEVAVSEFENLLVSDYDLFEASHFDDATARDFLFRAYAQHAADGRPFVVLMHPRIIGRHAGVLHDLIAHVRESGGRLLTIDGYLDGLAQLRGPRRRVLWLEMDPGADPARLVGVLVAEAASDVILNLPELTARDVVGPTRVAATVAALHGVGVKVHIAFPVSHNPALARDMPDAVMVDTAGARSTDWVSPSHPEIRRRLVQDATALVAGLGVDGLHLHGIGYPGLVWDFSPAALHRFTASAGISGVTPQDLLSGYFSVWTQWRAHEVASLVSEIASAARAEREDVVVGLSEDAVSATDYRAQEWTGQDLRLLGAIADRVVLWSLDSDRLGQLTVGQTLLAATTQAGDIPLLIGRRQNSACTPSLFPPEPNILALRLAIAIDGGGVVNPEADKYRLGCSTLWTGGLSLFLDWANP